MMSLLPSFTNGQEVLFQPDLSKIDGKEHTCKDGVQAKIVGVTFVTGKVLYDIVVWDEVSNDFYHCFPIQRVDSFMVCPQK